MANFLITTPNSLTQGTDTTDLFELTTALGTTVYAGGGADTIRISAAVTNGSNAVLEAGEGNDSIYLTAGGVTTTLAGIRIAAGAGSDLVAIEGAVTNSTLIGGGGNDTINFSGGTFGASTLFGNLGSDLISAEGGIFTNFFIAAGGDNDTITMSSEIISGTFNGGGGADLIQLIGERTISSTLVQGDDSIDVLYVGNDTIQIGGVGLSNSTVLGGGGADILQISATLASGNRFEGGLDADSIVLSSVSVVSAQLFIGMGAGNDTIVISAVLLDNFGTIQGGGGVDVINVSGGDGSGGLIYGGEGADLIGLGNLAGGAFESGAATTTVMSGVNVAYSKFTESNLAGFDVISAQATVAAVSGGNAFVVNQSAVTISAVATGIYGLGGSNQVTVEVNSRATTFAANVDSLTARAAALDANLGKGGSVLFQAGGSNYLFVQGGAVGAGTGDDLIVQLNVGGFTTTTANTNAGTGGIVGADANNIKIAFTNNTVF